MKLIYLAVNTMRQTNASLDAANSNVIFVERVKCPLAYIARGVWQLRVCFTDQTMTSAMLRHHTTIEQLNQTVSIETRIEIFSFFLIPK